MQHWIFPLECEVGLEVEGWVFERVERGDRILWRKVSGEIGFGGEVVDKEHAGEGEVGRWVLSTYGRTKSTISAEEIEKLLEARRGDFDAGGDRLGAGAHRDLSDAGTIRVGGEAAHRLVSLAGSERVGGIRRLLRRGRDRESRVWLLPLGEKVAERLPPGKSLGETWIEAGAGLFEEIEKESRIVFLDTSGTAGAAGRVALKVRREGEPGGAVKVECWRLDPALAAEKLQGLGKEIADENLLPGARRVVGEPAADLLELSSPEDGGLGVWLIAAGPRVQVAPDNSVLQTIEPGARVYWQEAGGDIKSWGTVIGADRGFATERDFCPLVIVRRRPAVTPIRREEVLEKSLRRFRPTIDPVEVWPESPEVAARLEGCWILSREGPVIVKVDEEVFREVEVGDPVLRVEDAKSVDLAGVVLAKGRRQASGGLFLRVDLTALEGDLPERVRTGLEEGTWPPRQMEARRGDWLASLTGHFKPVLERIRGRGYRVPGPLPGEPLSRVWLLPGGPVELDLRDQRVALGAPVLWRERTGGIRRWGRVTAERLEVDLEGDVERGRLPDELSDELEALLAKRGLLPETAPRLVEGERAGHLQELLVEALGAQGDEQTRECFWLLPPGSMRGSVVLEINDSRDLEWRDLVERGEIVLWRESQSSPWTWGRVREARRSLRVVTRALRSAIPAATVEEIFEPPVPRQLSEPEEVTAFFRHSRETPRSFEEAFREEMRAISLLRRSRGHGHPIRADPGIVAQADRAQLSGLAFSGGGIRSATFNLGILQGLVRRNLLRGFDYLSTVSGGGYIGSWLVAWIHRQGLARVEETLGRDDTERPSEAPAAKNGSPIAWLRSYSNFLTPNLGIFSADAWTFGATYLRNLILNLMVLATYLATLLLCPRIVVQFSMDLGYAAAGWMLWIALVLLAIGLSRVGRSVAALTDFLDPSVSKEPTRAGSESREPSTSTGNVPFGAVSWLFAATWAAAVWVWLSQDLFGWRIPLLDRVYEGLFAEIELFAGLDARQWLRWMLANAVLYTAAWQFFAFREQSWTAVKIGNPLVLKAFPAGLGGGVVLWWLARLLHEWTSGDFALMVLWGPPLILQVVVVTAVLHIGFMGRDFPEDHREWWSRLGAWMGICSVGWIALFSLALYGPVALVWLAEAGPAALSGVSLGWVASTVGGIWAARRAGDPGNVYKLPLKILSAVAPYVFAIGLLALLALAIQAAAAGIVGFEGSPAGDSFSVLLDHQLDATWQNPSTSLFWLMVVTLTLGGIAWLLSKWIDVNEFSMHPFYRNRLIRAYLGASNERRRQHPFIDLDPDDDVALQEILPAPSDLAGYAGPYPIFNATLNLVGGGELAWQQRKARPFFFDPLHYGFDTGRSEDDAERGSKAGFETFAIRCTAGARRGRGISLGTAATVSGAAVSSSMGPHTSPALAFLMTVLNARLGLWLGNPKHEYTWSEPGPEHGLVYLLAELFGRTHENAEYVNLSDGGHFENLGIYELVRRRCRFIVACDAEADPKFEFKGLGEAIRKCRIDLGVEIDLDLERLRPEKETGWSRWHCACGDIKYPEPSSPRGTLIYVKASLTGAEPEDLLNYRAVCPGFPHESTADQWFDESQFESYRKLGLHVADQVFGVTDPGRAAGSLEPVIVDLRQAWYRPSVAVEEAFTRHTALLDKIFERLRSQASLRYLIPQVYAELSPWVRGRPVWEADARGRRRRVERHPAAPQDLSRTEFREGFFLCNSVIQLMENVYVDLSLEKEWEHLDNRGWINLFLHWSRSWMFRLTWALSAGTYGARFQHFCERRLGLDVGEIHAEEVASYKKFAPRHLGATVAQESLDATERRLLRSLATALDETAVDSSRPGRRRLPGSPPTTVLSLRLRVSESLVLFETERRALDRPSPKALFEFTFGVAVLRAQKMRAGLADKPDHGLVFLHVREHLRNLGLDHRALRYLVTRQRLTLPPLVPRDEDLARVSRTLRRSTLEEMMFSAWNEAGPRSR